ncbi:uncharacterized protein LOC114354793 [Ostrinia furnacalis]|uniref:uncharacterized protein LOC114354793 n=1 Tax=Ostrinia furnacalis TaxID=93504 RepID=UPI00103B8E26|nr:uncharacterized protein LOC114354793 [Ostrinia furnacalis]
MTRLVVIGLLLTLHLTNATLDKLDIHKLTDAATAKLHSLKETVHTLKENAAYNIKHFADDIDLNNLHKLDVLQIGPALKKKYALLKELYHKPATKVNVVHIYGDELSSHFDHAPFVKYKEYVDDHGHHHHHHGHHHNHFHDLPYTLKRIGV